MDVSSAQRAVPVLETDRRARPGPSFALAECSSRSEAVQLLQQIGLSGA